MSEIQGRRSSTQSKIEALRGRLNEASSLIEGKACVFATGSYGRLEAGPESDLDLCIIGLETDDAKSGQRKRSLSNLNAISIKSDFIRALKNENIKELDGDGRYFSHYTVDSLAKGLGNDDDDYRNFLTTRLLVLLEGRPLIGESAREAIIGDLLAAYWRDYENHRDDFIPAFLGNDILRLWRTFCVNYEARTNRHSNEQKEKGKIKNYKLKHSRLLTCFSALIYMLYIFGDKKTMTVADAQKMTALTPTQRIEAVRDASSSVPIRTVSDKILSLYEWFLQSTSNEKDLGVKLMSSSEKAAYSDNTFDFGNNIFEMMKIVGNESRLHRLLVV